MAQLPEHCVQMGAVAHMSGSEGNLRESVFAFHKVSPRD